MSEHSAAEARVSIEKERCTCRLIGVERQVSKRGLMSLAATYEYDTTGCPEHGRGQS